MITCLSILTIARLPAQFPRTSYQEKPVKHHQPLCPFDKLELHPAHCSTYKNAILEQRRRMVSDKKLCLNFLGQHLKADCKSHHSCRSYSRKRHSSLHDDIGTTLDKHLNKLLTTQILDRQQKRSLVRRSPIKVFSLQIAP